MRIIRIILLVGLLLSGFSCRPSVETFSYPMAAPPPEASEESFYVPPASDAVLPNIPDCEVRNVIFCIGDGMGFNHVAMARNYSVGLYKKLNMELLPITGQVMTHSANKEVTDSAAAATALACGIKTNNSVVGMAPDKKAYSSILELLDKKGWRTGLVVTSTISHATPAGFAAHVDSRNEEKDIAVQLLNNRVDVLFGGGRKYWGDGLLSKATTDGYQVIETRNQMLALGFGPVIGLFAKDGMTTFAPEPSLAEMAQMAIQLLSSQSKDWFAPNPRFFLMIEGSQIDWAAHANDTERDVRQVLLFDMAVRQAIEFAKRDGHTLVIVTADHETGGLKLESDSTKKGGIEVTWTTKSHTAANVPICAYGPGSEKFAGMIDNTDIPKRIAELTGITEFPAVKTEITQEATAR
jgi:alkaline phosphatase